MKRSITILAIVFMLLTSGCTDSVATTVTAPATEPSEAADPKFLEISALPTGLEVVHSPNKPKAKLGGLSRRRYTWLYQTSVRSKEEMIAIVEFGAFVWQNNHWVFATIRNEPFTPEDFADWYSCPRGLLWPGNTYVDPNNWSGGDELRRSRTMWYYVGIDKAGRRVKGTAIVDEQAETEN